MPASDGNGTSEGVWIFEMRQPVSASGTDALVTARRVEVVSRCVDTGLEDSEGGNRRTKPWAIEDLMREGGEHVELYIMFSITNDNFVRGLRFVRILLSRGTFSL